jgi:hypothetical protein
MYGSCGVAAATAAAAGGTVGGAAVTVDMVVYGVSEIEKDKTQLLFDFFD